MKESYRNQFPIQCREITNFKKSFIAKKNFNTLRLKIIKLSKSKQDAKNFEGAKNKR